MVVLAIAAALGKWDDCLLAAQERTWSLGIATDRAYDWLGCRLSVGKLPTEHPVEGTGYPWSI
jgi:hypothetical protein